MVLPFGGLSEGDTSLRQMNSIACHAVPGWGQRPFAKGLHAVGLNWPSRARQTLR